MSEINIWPVHFADDIPRWRVVTFDESGVIVAERTFHDEEEAREYYITLKGMNTSKKIFLKLDICQNIIQK